MNQKEIFATLLVSYLRQMSTLDDLFTWDGLPLSVLYRCTAEESAARHKWNAATPSFQIWAPSTLLDKNSVNGNEVPLLDRICIWAGGPIGHLLRSKPLTTHRRNLPGLLSYSNFS